jgi:hypothetical protein
VNWLKAIHHFTGQQFLSQALDIREQIHFIGTDQ